MAVFFQPTCLQNQHFLQRENKQLPDKCLKKIVSLMTSQNARFEPDKKTKHNPVSNTHILPCSQKVFTEILEKNSNEDFCRVESIVPQGLLPKFRHCVTIFFKKQNVVMSNTWKDKKGPPWIFWANCED